jgi:5-formyltetrahydrofolate cyclo-ligase
VTVKQDLRRELRLRCKAHVDALPDTVRALVFSRPPGAVAQLVPEGATVAIYYPFPTEAPALAYGRWFHERGHRVALPWFADRSSAMQFREWANPFDDSLLVPDPFKAFQPGADAAQLEPEVVFVPLLGFSAQGARIGQGAGHYDRWLATHAPRAAIGLAWDCQLIEQLPTEPHDMPLTAVVTPTRLYGPF